MTSPSFVPLGGRSLFGSLKALAVALWRIVFGTAGLLAIFLLLAGLWIGLTGDPSEPSGVERAQVGSEGRVQRATAQALADTYNRIQARLKDLKLEEVPVFELALVETAKGSTVSVERLQGTLQEFADRVEGSGSADPFDVALVAFSRGDFAGAKEAADVPAAPTAEHRDRLRIKGQALVALGNYGEAVEAFEGALRVTSRSDLPEPWADLQFRRGEAAAMGSDASSQEVAESAFTSALEVFREDQWSPQAAMALNERAACRVSQAFRLDAAEDNDLVWTMQAKMAREAAEDHREAAKAFYSLSEQRWLAHAKFDLADALRLASALQSYGVGLGGKTPSEQLAEAEAALRRALKVQAHDECPMEWGRTQRELAGILYLRALENEGARRAGLIEECRIAYGDAFSAITREGQPYQWYRVAHSMAANWWERAHDEAEWQEPLGLLEKALELQLSNLPYFSDGSQSKQWETTQHWVARIQVDIVGVLSDQQRDHARVIELSEDAVDRMRGLLALPEDDRPPNNRPMAQYHLAVALWHRGMASEGLERSRWLTESVAEAERYIELYHDELFDDGMQPIREWIDSMESDIADLR